MAVPVIVLDPTGADHHGEAARLRAAGPVVRVVLPGGVRAWAVTRHADLVALVRDARFSKDWRNWNAVANGEIPEGWPLTGMLKVDTMATADRERHHRLRGLLTRTLTGRRVAELRPRVTGIVESLLDALPGHTAADGTVDLRPHFAVQVPMRVICELTGVPEAWRPQLRELVETTATPVARIERERIEFLHALVALRADDPGDDLTSTLISVRAEDPDALTATELADTLWLLLTAGHETTLSLILNATRALLTHPDQRVLARPGDQGTWAAVVEETLRWDAPVGNFMARYPLQDIEVAGVTIPAGEAVLAPYSAVGRDPGQHGPDADRFDITRPPHRHLAFGDGAHVCPGAFLARLETTIALRALFIRYPDMALAARPDALTPVKSLFTNTAQALPVRLRGLAWSGGAGVLR
jgi:2-hydroxy-5-methyl-1-naphthoate 7-hydroxylase